MSGYKQATWLTHSLDPTEIACAAGFFNGEGTTHAPKDSRRKTPSRNIRLQVVQKDTAELARWVAAVGAGSISIPRRGCSVAYVCRTGQALSVLTLLWPWLSEQKKQQALAAVHALQ
jgi:hypothetical protein